MTTQADSTEFENLKKGLATWSSSKDRPELWPEVEKVANSLIERLGEIVRVHIPKSNTYIGLTFADLRGRIGAYISVGHVEHVIEIEGSFPSETSPGYWRTQLSSAWISTSPVYESKVESFVCPRDNIAISKYAECHICGWSPGEVS